MAATSTSTSAHTVLLLGATGAVGSEVLSSLLASPHFATIHSFVRKPSSTPPEPGSSRTHNKVVEHLVDFEKLCEGDGSQVDMFKEVKADSVLITLGTTRAAAGGAKPFERIDREYVLAAAKAARREDGKPQKVVYCSGPMADSTSRFLYPKSKGLTEEGLSSLGYSDVILFRPGFLYGAQRAQSRPTEHLFGLLTHHVLSKFSDSAEIHTSLLAKCMVESINIGADGLKSKGIGSAPTASAFAASTGSVVVLNNAQALQMAKNL